jgi:3-phenylpropionate/trans-cinnamate dioxygenase ferredoxin reductase component
MRSVVVVGGSIAAVTAVDALRLGGYDGELTLISEECDPPYSRVPLSKGVLAGTQEHDSVWLTALPETTDVRLETRAAGLDTVRRRVRLADGTEVAYDGLVIATGASPRRLASPGQRGELVVRTIADAEAIATRAAGASTAVVVGGGFLGMEVASTLVGLGLSVTVIDRDPPLQRLLGDWLSSFMRQVARDAGVRIVQASGDVTLLGDPVGGVAHDDGQELLGDLTISAVGDVACIDWLAESGLPLAGGVVIDDCCRVAEGIVAAGDVTVRRLPNGSLRRTPHWTSAVEQGRSAARNLLNPCAAAPYTPDPYFWTEQFALDVKISGELPLVGEPVVLEGDPSQRSMLLQWFEDGHPVAAAAVNHRMPVVKLKRLRSAVPAS